jgi:hypothetical protein
MAHKPYNLGSGFLLLYEWLPTLEMVPAHDFKEVVMALIARQRDQLPLPRFNSQLADVFARTFEPVIQRRLDGQNGGKKAKDNPPTIPPSPTPLPKPPTQPKRREEKIREDKRSGENNTTRVPRSAPPTGSDVYAERFAEFWKAYPKKVGKEAARKAFMKIKPSADLLQRMLEAIKAQTASDQWKRDNGQYIPNPATWLNQGRWEDEPPAAAKSQNNDMSMEEFFNGH